MGERRGVELLWADDKSTAKGARTAAEELVPRKHYFFWKESE